MPDPLPSCFGGSTAGPPPSSTSSGPTLITSVYSTPLGPAALSWSRTVLGLLLRLELRLSSDNDEDCDVIALKIRPWLLFSRRGSRRSHHGSRSRSLLLSWDLSRATFPSSGGPEPSSGYFVSLAVDGQIVLVAGDLADLAFKRMKINRNTTTTSASDDLLNSTAAALISRREHVAMGEEGRSCYRTLARFGGKERSITIDLGGEMKLEVDGESVLQIRRLRWKFRGSERVEVDGRDRIQISWDLHSWIFPPKDGRIGSGGGGDVSGGRSAVFVFRFENEENETLVGGGGGYLCNMNESSSGQNDDKKRRSLHKTSSSSSSSSSSASSSAGSWTVMEWASTEEKELRSREGFSLVVHAWKS